VRVVLDANVLVSAALSRSGAPAGLLTAALEAEIELVACPALLDETARALASPRLRKRVAAADAERLLDLVRELADVVPDPEGPAPIHSPDPADDYLLALAAREQVPLVSGDEHLLGLRGRAPVLSPREFLDQLPE
jgi:putative PIN family toxin of toxin-antitoxin system